MDYIPFRDRVTCTVNEACQATGLGRSSIYELIGEGRLETTKVNGRRLILVRSVLKLAEPSAKAA